MNRPCGATRNSLDTSVLIIFSVAVCSTLKIAIWLLVSTLRVTPLDAVRFQGAVVAVGLSVTGFEQNIRETHTGITLHTTLAGDMHVRVRGSRSWAFRSHIFRLLLISRLMNS